MSKTTPTKSEANGRLRWRTAQADLEILAAQADGQGDKLRRFRMTAYTGSALRLAGWPAPVVLDLSGLKAAQQRPVLREHDVGRIVGHTESIEVSEQRLRITGVISGVGPDVEELLALADNGFPWQASVGASADQVVFVEAGDSAKINGRNWPGPVYVVRQWTLAEISFVAVAADQQTSAVIATGVGGCGMDADFRAWLTAKNFDPAALSADQLHVLEAAWRAEQPEEPADYQQVIAQRRTELQRRQRIAAIVEQITADRPDLVDEMEKLAAAAVEGNWTVTQFELEALRASRPRSPGICVRRDRSDDPRVVEAAVCLAAKLPDIERHYSPEILEAAASRWPHGLTLNELLLTAAQRHGYQGVSVRAANVRSLLEAAFARDIQAGRWGPSTYDVSNLLSNVATKFLRQQFEAVDNAWSRIAARRAVSDFKTIYSYSLTGDLEYEQVAPSGEIRHGQVAAREYSNKADTYGKVIGISRTDLINDDLGALANVGRRLGRGAALKINDVFWRTFLNNSTFFSAANNNVITGASSALSLEGLRLADSKFRLQTDPDGKPLGVMPRILLVPTALRITALQLMNSIGIQSGNTASPMGLPDRNPFAGAFDVVSSPYMQNASYTGWSDTAWYLLADPNDLPVIEICFLDGQETPTIETVEPDANMLGLCLRAYHDFGVALQEFRGGVRAAGA